MIIYGEKIHLRGIETDDNAMLLDMMNDPGIEKMIGGFSWPSSMEDQMRWYSKLGQEQTTMRCIIAENDNNKAIGTLIINEINMKNGTGHIHIKIANGSSRGKGVGTEAIHIAVNYAFSELRLNCIFANILAYNLASVKLFEKCGFHRDGILRERVFKQGKYHDLYTYSKLSSDESKGI